ncbi:MAG: Zn-ribbon domain-containing OB-fold protein [Elusimicrobia bacterium]|nr:Zn-ribbon domain-containing OB-fold protein [Elusimicrobiota bacterium]
MVETQIKPLVHESRIKIPYSWSAGEIGSRFLKELAEHKKILGRRCSSCNKVFCPPKKICGFCFKECGEWVEVGPDGTLVAFTQALYPSAAHPTERPVYGLIKLKGADTAILHLLGGVALEKLLTGMTVKPIFKENRQGHILDILHFVPVEGTDGR